MARHYLRENKHYSNENINPDLTRYNLVFCAPEIANEGLSPNELISRRLLEAKEITGRAVRVDAVVMCDWVVTAPKDLDPDRYGEFFNETINFLTDRYGAENLVVAAIHVDEVSPHIHYAFTPRDSEGLFRAKYIVDRKDLQTFHADLQKHLQDTMHQKYSVLLDPEQKAQRELSAVPHEQYKLLDRELKQNQELNRIACQQIDQQTKIIESQKQQQHELNQANNVLKQSNAGLIATKQELTETIQGMRNDCANLQNRSEYLRLDCARKEQEIKRIDAGIRELDRRVGELKEQIQQQKQAREIDRDSPSVSRELVRGAQRLYGQARGDAGSLAEREQQERSRAESIDKRIEPERIAAQKRIGGLEESRENAIKSLEQKRETIKETEKRIELIEGRRDAINERLSDLREHRDQLRERIGRAIDRLREIKPVHEIREKLNELKVDARVAGQKLVSYVARTIGPYQENYRAQSLSERSAQARDVSRVYEPSYDREYSRGYER